MLDSPRYRPHIACPAPAAGIDPLRSGREAKHPVTSPGLHTRTSPRPPHHEDGTALVCYHPNLGMAKRVADPIITPRQREDPGIPLDPDNVALTFEALRVQLQQQIAALENDGPSAGPPQ